MNYGPVIRKLEGELEVLRMAQHNRLLARRDLYAKIAEIDDRESESAALREAIERTIFILANCPN